MYCKKCGAKIDSYASNCPFCGEPIANNQVQATYSSDFEGSVKPRSIGSWILVYIISLIPLVGLIMLFVWAFGSSYKNDKTFSNWAKAQLIIMAAAFVLSIVFMGSLVGSVLGGF